MIVEFIDGSTADCIGLYNGNSFIGSVGDVAGYISYSKDATHIAILTSYGNKDTMTHAYPIDKVLCVHKDISTLRDKKIDTIID